MQLGIAIATFNRFSFTFDAFLSVYEDLRVSHVALSDDCSQTEIYRNLEHQAYTMPKVTLVRNERNLGSWANKRKAMELCTSEWVALIDSDNTIGPGYLDALSALPEWDKDTLYVPVRGVPALNYDRFEGLVITKDTVAERLSDPLFQMLLNTGNFFVHRATHLEVSGGDVEESYASDGIYFVYRWLASGRRILVTPNLSYCHLVHDGHWRQTAQQSLAFANELVRRMQGWGTSCVA